MIGILALASDAGLRWYKLNDCARRLAMVEKGNAMHPDRAPLPRQPILRPQPFAVREVIQVVRARVKPFTTATAAA